MAEATRSSSSSPRPVRWHRETRSVIIQNGDVIANDSNVQGGALSTVIERSLFKVWTRTHNYRFLKATGAPLPENPFRTEAYFDHFSSEIEVKSGGIYRDSSTFVDNTSTYTVDTRGLYQPNVDENFELVSQFELDTKLVNKLKSAEWNAPVFFREAGQTVSMVLGTARSLAAVLRDLRRGNIEGVFKTLDIRPDRRVRKKFLDVREKDPTRAAANAWLSLQYGWVPLLSDVESAMQVLASRSLAENERTHVELFARVKRDAESSRVVPFQVDTVGSGTLLFKESRYDSRSYTLRYRPKWENNFGQLGLLNPALVAWELVPLSFVADWFLPIGDYLNGLDVEHRYQFLSGLASRKIQFTSELQKYNGSGKWSGSEGSESYGLTRVSASPLAEIPTPKLSQLSFKPELGLKRFFSGLALLRVEAIKSLMPRLRL
jgi:hypothetical protein